jgi:ASC-1-like (ASCH) protein
MADQDRAGYLAEAYKRGLLPPEMKAQYEEALKRGLVKVDPSAAGAQNADAPPQGSGGPQGTVPAPAAPSQSPFERNKAWSQKSFNPGGVYITVLPSNEEANFQKWARQYNVPFDPPNKYDSDYDMRGYYQAFMRGDKRATSAVDDADGKRHWPDYWKTPHHQTFSAESKWAVDGKAPKWQGNKLVTPDGKVLYDEGAANVDNRGAYKQGVEHASPGEIADENANGDKRKAFHDKNLAEADKVPEPTVHQMAQSGTKYTRYPDRSVQSGGSDLATASQTLPGSAQVLYDALTNDPERVKLLSHLYGREHIGADANGLYVRLPSGRKMYPGGLNTDKGRVSDLIAGAPRTLGSMAGLAGGVTLGSATGSLPGAVAGAEIGAGTGAAAGQRITDEIVRLSGYYDRTPDEEMKGLAKVGSIAALSGGAGALGPEIALPAARGLQYIYRANPDTLLVPNALNIARELAQKGYEVNPGSYTASKFLPRQVKMTSLVTHYDPLQASAKRYVENESAALFEKDGMSKEEARATVKGMKTSEPSYENAGDELQQEARADYDKEKAKLDAKLQAIEYRAKTKGETDAELKEESLKAAKEMQAKYSQKVHKALLAGFRRIKMMKYPRPKQLAGDLSEAVTNLRKHVTEAANRLYEPAYPIAGDAPIDMSAAKDTIENFLRDLPEDLRKNFPAVIRDLNRMLGREEEGVQEEGGAVSGPPTMTLRELHTLRSYLRDMGYSESLTPSFKKGPYNMMAAVVDNIMHNPENPEAVRRAMAIIDKGDEYYAHNMKQFSSEALQAMVDSVRAGLPPNPSHILDLAADSGQMSTLKRIQDIGGPELSKRLASADIDRILAVSTGIDDRVNPQIFVREVNDRDKSGLLRAIHGDENAALIKDYAQKLAAKNDIIPVESLTPGDFAHDLQLLFEVNRSIETMEGKNALATLEQAAKGEKAVLSKEFADRMSGKKNAMAILRNPNMSGIKAAEKIITNTRMLKAAIAKFGENSKGLQMLRRAALQRILAPVIQGKGANSIKEHLFTMTKEQQDLLFPNGMADDLRKIADALYVITGGPENTTPGMSAGNVLNKQSIWRRAIPQFIDTVETWIVTRPAFTRVIAADLSRKGAYAKTLFQIRNYIAAASAGVGAYAARPENAGTEEGRKTVPTTDPRVTDPKTQKWRDLLEDDGDEPRGNWRDLVKPQGRERRASP